MKQYLHFKIILCCLLLAAVINSNGQQSFTHTAAKENISCNNDCTLLDVPELNNNPLAILFVTPILEKGVDLNPHPIGVYYFKNQWRIFNLDQKTMPAGSTFNVEYVAKPDATHFQYLITRENLQKDGTSIIDHPAMNNNPNAQFRFFPSWVPELQGATANRDEVSIQFNADAGKWYVSNINKKPLYTRVAYNIIISTGANTVVDPVKGNPGILIAVPPAIVKPAEPIPTTTPIDKPDIQNKKTIPTSYDFSQIRICVDKINNNSLPAKPVYIPPTQLPKINSSGQLEQVTAINQGLTGETAKMWSPGDVITVGFTTGEASSFVINKVMEIAKEWETIANIKFVFVNLSQAKVRVGFADDGTSWSWVGREVLTNPFNVKTVNFGWFNDATSETEFRRVILHEFGHVLGFVHEHQSPTAGISWDKEKLYAFFAQEPDPWDRATVDRNVLQKYSQSSTNFSAYDPLSIMHYFFPADLTTDGTSFTSNSNFSPTDKQFSRTVYPFPPTPANATGILHTGDDCDEIEFTVEYNVVPQNEVEFTLTPGRDHNNALVNWWKMIGIQHKSGIVDALYLNTTKKIPFFMIDKTKPITFGKAKTLGVHTGLGFTWNPWPAIVGGCRVKFVWRRDSCN